MQRKKILITGANGFIGKALLNELHLSKMDVRAIVRNNLAINCMDIVFENISPDTDWSRYLSDIDVVIHTAGLAHILGDVFPDSLEQFRKDNVDATINLARQSAILGVRRFIFLSSVKALGDQTSNGIKFSSDSSYAPTDCYGISKMEAEIKLQEIAQLMGFELVIIRPPLVYGPGAKANLLRLMKLARSTVPLPIANFTNKRSMVSVQNLVDFIILCIHSPNAANQVLMVSDDNDISVLELINKLHFYFGRHPVIFRLPNCLLKFIFKFLGKESEFLRLTNSLEIDIEKSKSLLGWTPPLDLDAGLKIMVEDFLRLHAH